MALAPYAPLVVGTIMILGIGGRLAWFLRTGQFRHLHYKYDRLTDPRNYWLYVGMVAVILSVLMVWWLQALYRFPGAAYQWLGNMQ